MGLGIGIPETKQALVAIGDVEQDLTVFFPAADYLPFKPVFDCSKADAVAVGQSSLVGLPFTKGDWMRIVAALETRQVSPDMLLKLDSLAWKLDEERTATLARMRYSHA